MHAHTTHLWQYTVIFPKGFALYLEDENSQIWQKNQRACFESTCYVTEAQDNKLLIFTRAVTVDALTNALMR